MTPCKGALGILLCTIWDSVDTTRSSTHSVLNAINLLEYMHTVYILITGTILHTIYFLYILKSYVIRINFSHVTHRVDHLCSMLQLKMLLLVWGDQNK